MSGVLRLELGDGRAVEMDTPPGAIMAAAQRVQAACVQRTPASDPAVAAASALLLAWLGEQERRHPSPDLAPTGETRQQRRSRERQQRRGRGR